MSFAFLVVVAVNIVFAVMLLRLMRGSRGTLPSTQPSRELPRLSVVVPARNEERQIEDCVRSLLAQSYPHLNVIVVDDCSDDATAAIVERIAAGDARLRLVRGRPLPAGWVGKPWALAQGAEVATGAWILFTDADTVHESAAADSAVRYAQRNGIAFLSLLTEQVCVTWGERAYLPWILLTIALGVGSLDDVNDPRKRDVALFNGQYLLARRDAYDTLGGHAAVKGEIAEDYEFAKLIKRDGRYRSMLVATDLVRVRMYRSFVEIWVGFTKNLALGVRGRLVLAAGALVFFALLAPGTEIALAWSLLLRQWSVAAALLTGLVATVVAAEAAMERLRLPVRSGASAAWLPLGMTLTLATFAASLAKHASGGVVWRGRRYGGAR